MVGKNKRAGDAFEIYPKKKRRNPLAIEKGQKNEKEEKKRNRPAGELRALLADTCPERTGMKHIRNTRKVEE